MIIADSAFRRLYSVFLALKTRRRQQQKIHHVSVTRSYIPRNIVPNALRFRNDRERYEFDRFRPVKCTYVFDGKSVVGRHEQPIRLDIFTPQQQPTRATACDVSCAYAYRIINDGTSEGYDKKTICFARPRTFN